MKPPPSTGDANAMRTPSARASSRSAQARSASFALAKNWPARRRVRRSLARRIAEADVRLKPGVPVLGHPEDPALLIEDMD